MVVITPLVDTDDALGDGDGSDVVGTLVGYTVGILVGVPGVGVGSAVGMAVGMLDGRIVGAFVVDDDDDPLILRMRLFSVSAMYTLPDESTATPFG